MLYPGTRSFTQATADRSLITQQEGTLNSMPQYSSEQATSLGMIILGLDLTSGGLLLQPPGG